MTPTPTFTQQIAQMQAELCAAFTDPTRILILYVLNAQPRNVGEIAQELQITHSAASRHLKVLRERGLVMTDRHGTVVQYSLADPRLIEALDILRTVLRDLVLMRTDVAENMDT